MFARIFVMLVLGILSVQLFNVVLLLICPPPKQAIYTATQIEDALIKGVLAPQMRIRVVSADKIRPQNDQLGSVRDRLAAQMQVAPAALNIEIPGTASSSSTADGRSRWDYWDGIRLSQIGQPGASEADLAALHFSGHFKIALRQADGDWRVLSTVDTLFTAWKARAIWALASTVLLAIPFAYLLARWLAAPIREFGVAAERLGRDPRAPPLEVCGPTEISAAADAFNAMQARLGRYVDDRVAMVGAIAHDLRTPLMRLSFRLDKAPDDIRVKAEADIAEMKHMLAAVLEFVRTMQVDRPRQRQELRSLITSIADDLTDVGHNVLVEDGPDVVIEGDTLGLRSLFTNLIENAVTYGGNARVRLHAEGREAIVHIDDDGPGLPPEELERVFEPFYRHEPSRNRETGGTGLGLATVRSVVLAHGGEATLENRRDGGLRARVALPL